VNADLAAMTLTCGHGRPLMLARNVKTSPLRPAFKPRTEV